MGLDVGLLSLCGCKGCGDLIVGSGLEVFGHGSQVREKIRKRGRGRRKI